MHLAVLLESISACCFSMYIAHKALINTKKLLDSKTTVKIV